MKHSFSIFKFFLLIPIIFFSKDGYGQKIKNATIVTNFIKKEIPVLSYHNIKEFKSTDSEIIKTYTVTPKAFAEQMEVLSKNGFHTLSPNQLNDYYNLNKPLPEKSILITFDDTRLEHYSVCAPILEKYHFKGVFFIMTVSINRPNYMNTVQIKKLSQNGHTIGAHTWDHHKVATYTGKDWEIQLSKPKKKLELIIGKSVTTFAYPYGLWNTETIVELKKRGYKTGFILSNKSDPVDKLFTIRRIVVPGTWSTSKMLSAIESSFK
jgi:peptidoglycan/xylan/chitin deacetylase (PgdA/CDA1 family)